MNRSFIKIAIIVIFLAIWEFVGRQTNRILLVPPSTVAVTLGRILTLQIYPDLPVQIWITIFEIIVAFVASAAIGLAAGFVLGMWRTLRNIYQPVITAWYAIPEIVWYPSILMILGLGVESKILYAFMLACFPIIVATTVGVSKVDKTLILQALSMGARPFTVFFKVIIPASATTIVSGLKIGVALTVINVLVAEFLGSTNGLGHLIIQSEERFQTDRYLALVIIALAIAISINMVISYAEKRIKRRTAG